MSDYRLQPEMTPSSLFGRSIYSVLREYGLRCYWEGVIRRQIAMDAHGRCQVCDVRKDSIYERVTVTGTNLPWASCHEVWEYDFKSETATVVDLKLICRRCNLSIHIGIAASEFSGLGNNKAWDEIMAHIARVNEISIGEAEAIANEVLGRSSIHDQVDWKPVISESLQERFPALQLISL